VRLHEIIQDDIKDKIYLILDYCNRGTLLSLNDDDNTFTVNPNITKNAFYTEDQIRDMTRDIVMAIDYLHMHGIIHRDIKPDNILIDDFNHCKLTDFNVSAMLENVNDDNVGKKIEGTDSFRAPECCGDTEESKDLRGKPLDIWALGVTCYLLAYLDLPFKAENEWDTLGLFDAIAKAEFTFRDDKRYMSNGFKEFIRKCFEKEPNKRITIEEIKELKWINEKRTPLKEMKHPEKIFVTDEEIGKCASFFVSVGMLKKLANTWKNYAGME
jgi:[calcium/calmodulin-dependent protein kinase] kinase